MIGGYQIRRSERTTLVLGVFISGVGKQKCGYINLSLGSIYILEGGMTKVRLRLLSYGKLGHSFVTSGIGMPRKTVFPSEFFYIAGDSPLGMVFFVMLFPPVVDLRC